MDPVSFTITLASLSSIFQTCLAAYDCLADALAMGDTALGLEIRFRIETMRMRLWGESQGFSSVTNKPRARTADLMEVPEIRRLVLDILGRMIQLLEKHIQATKKGGSDEPTLALDPRHHPAFSLSDVLKAKTRLDQRIANITKRNSFFAKIRWALKDKATLEGLVTELTYLNDGLDHLLPRNEAANLSQGLAGEILSSIPTLTDFTDPSFVWNNSKTSKILEIRRQNGTSRAEHLSSSSVDSSDVLSTPFNHSLEAERSWEIPIGCFKDFKEPYIKDVLVHETPTSRVGTTVDVPDKRSIYYYTPEGKSGEHVLVEWRSQNAESRYSSIKPAALAKRRDHLAALLYRTCATDTDFHVLNCLGYTLATGRLPEGEKHPIVGFVYQLPVDTPDCKPTPPISLRDIVGTAFESQNPNVPDLEDRLLLAQKLALALYQLQCAGWIHRKLSSYNILYFQDYKSESFDVTKFYICGWQYSRPDHHVDPAPDAHQANHHMVSEQSTIRSLGDMDMYVHPDRLENERFMPRFRKSYDIYSFGVIMVEIAFWEPVLAFADPKSRNAMKLFEPDIDIVRPSRSSLVKATEDEMGAEMGRRYRTAVLNCLKGLRSSNGHSVDLAPDDMNALEPGIEKEFFWHVVEELRCATNL